MRAKDLVSSSQFYSLRLQPGAELIEQLRQFIQVNHIKAGWIASVVGSLSSVSLRYAGCEWTSLIEGKFEVIALGELSIANLNTSTCPWRMKRGE